MYNGIGLRTPRGSGTNGYVQKNNSFVKPSVFINGSNRKPGDLSGVVKPTIKKPSRPVLLHMERRRVEIELLKLKDELEDKGEHDNEEIEKIIQAERIKRYADIDKLLDTDLKLEKEIEMERVTEAFGIEKGYKEGDAFKFDCVKKSEDSSAGVKRIKDV